MSASQRWRRRSSCRYPVRRYACNAARKPHGYGSRVGGSVGPDSDIDLLITADDAWLATHDRFQVLNDLWDRLSRHDVSLDLLLYSHSEVEARKNWKTHVIGRAYRQGRLLHGAA
jgi:uncharacterized protein